MRRVPRHERADEGARGLAPRPALSRPPVHGVQDHGERRARARRFAERRHGRRDRAMVRGYPPQREERRRQPGGAPGGDAQHRIRVHQGRGGGAVLEAGCQERRSEASGGGIRRAPVTDVERRAATAVYIKHRIERIETRIIASFVPSRDVSRLVTFRLQAPAATPSADAAFLKKSVTCLAPGGASGDAFAGVVSSSPSTSSSSPSFSFPPPDLPPFVPPADISSGRNAHT
mmetsp:Transcript_9890/g.38583  ORF Transcript_9890/g.38583 Transcript_9890/m.38583 type:complete len:231 (+) Transcript_9890:306-998(+)